MEKYGNSLMEYELNLNKILRLIKENMISIVLWMGIGIFAALIAIFFIVTPKYSATTDLLVNQKSDNQQTQYTMQQADLQSINTYKDILKKRGLRPNENLLGFISIRVAEFLRWLAKPITTLLLYPGLGPAMLRQHRRS